MDMNNEQERDTSTPYMENSLEFNTYLASPAARDELKFFEQNKDLILSCLKDDEITHSRVLISMIRYCDLYGLKNSLSCFQSDLMGLVNTARARGGFERNLLGSRVNVMKQESEIREISGKKGIFDRGKRR